MLLDYHLPFAEKDIKRSIYITLTAAVTEFPNSLKNNTIVFSYVQMFNVDWQKSILLSLIKFDLSYVYNIIEFRGNTILTKNISKASSLPKILLLIIYPTLPLVSVEPKCFVVHAN